MRNLMESSDFYSLSYFTNMFLQTPHDIESSFHQIIWQYCQKSLIFLLYVVWGDFWNQVSLTYLLPIMPTTIFTCQEPKMQELRRILGNVKLIHQICSTNWTEECVETLRTILIGLNVSTYISWSWGFNTSHFVKDFEWSNFGVGNREIVEVFSCERVTLLPN